MDYKEVAVEALKVSPPATVGTLAFFGVPVSNVILALTLVYAVLQLYFLLRDKWWRDRERTAK